MTQLPMPVLQLKPAGRVRATLRACRFKKSPARFIRWIDAQRHQALSELTELSQELGFYTPEDDRLTEAISPA